MSGLMSRGAILTGSRVSNFAILMFSPLLLVRILDVDSYGQYQEFMIYATLFVAVCAFGIDSSLTYFLPRYPDQEREFVSQNSVLVLLSSSLFLGAFLLLKEPFLEIATYDFVLPLAAYVFFFVNLNWLEYYWIAKRRPDLVLFYSAGRLVLRVTVLLVVAYLTRDVNKILWSIVSAEALRLLVVAMYLFRARLLVITMDLSRTKEQLRFAGPVGLAGLTQQGSRHIGKLFIGSVLGPAALAYYAVASYLLPLVLVIRGSIADVVFPELVRIRDNPEGVILLWQRSNIVFCMLLFPPFVVLNYYAELFIGTLFTAEYLEAVPVFHVYLFWFVRRCFNMDVLLRTRGRTTFMLTGTVTSVVINFALMVLLYHWFGLIGPAVAYIAAEVLLEFYYAILVKREFGLTVAQLVDWKGLMGIVIGCTAAVPMLVVLEHAPAPPLAKAAIGSCGFVAISWFIAYHLGVRDIGRIMSFALSRMPKFRRS